MSFLDTKPDGWYKSVITENVTFRFSQRDASSSCSSKKKTRRKKEQVNTSELVCMHVHTTKKYPLLPSNNTHSYTFIL